MEKCHRMTRETMTRQNREKSVVIHSHFSRKCHQKRKKGLFDSSSVMSIFATN